jgi:hypothetical protein
MLTDVDHNTTNSWREFKAVKALYLQETTRCRWTAGAEPLPHMLVYKTSVGEIDLIGGPGDSRKLSPTTMMQDIKN